MNIAKELLLEHTCDNCKYSLSGSASMYMSNELSETEKVNISKYCFADFVLQPPTLERICEKYERYT